MADPRRLSPKICAAVFARDSRRRLCDIRPKTVLALRSRKMSQFRSRSQAFSPRTKGRVSPGIAVTIEDSGMAPRRAFYERLCEASVRLPEACDTRRRCAVARRDGQGPISPPARRDPRMGGLQEQNPFPPQLRAIDQCSLKPQKAHQTWAIEIITWSGARPLLSFGANRDARWHDDGGLGPSPYFGTMSRLLRFSRSPGAAFRPAPQRRPPLQTIEPLTSASPCDDAP